MNCGNCGNANEQGSEFCSSCGTKLNLANDSLPNSQTSTSPPPYASRGKLYRSRDDRWVGGVSGGIGEHYDIDPNMIRINWLILIFTRGTGVLAYIIAWFIIPENPIVKPRSY